MHRRGRYEFDSQRFIRDLRQACADLGVNLAQCARDLGIERSRITYMESSGKVPEGRILVALAAYGGLNLNTYLIDFEEPRFPQYPSGKPWTFVSALERIK